MGKKGTEYRVLVKKKKNLKKKNYLKHLIFVGWKLRKLVLKKIKQHQKKGGERGGGC